MGLGGVGGVGVSVLTEDCAVEDSCDVTDLCQRKFQPSAQHLQMTRRTRLSEVSGIGSTRDGDMVAARNAAN